ncbi:MAG TPA: hypothetical protein VF660_02215 [Actinomycetota bacterium]
MDFFEALRELGFASSEERPSRGARTYIAQPNQYLTYWVHVYDDGTALFTWEFAVTDFLLERGVQLGSSETLNLFMFPREDERGPQEPSWLAGAMDRAEDRLRSLDFADPDA